MKTCIHNHSQFFYETENIPDHRSRRFGCCASLLGRIKTVFPNKKAVSGRQPEHGGCKTNHALKSPILPFHHIMAAFAKQAGKGSSQKSTPI